MCIHEAANHGYRDIVEFLLENGAQSSINDKGGIKCDGITPLYDAASNGHLSTVQLLIDRGAKLNIKTDSNQTPLDALTYWYESNHDKLTSSEKEFYEQIKEQLIRQCEKVGMGVNKTLPSASSGNSSVKHKSSQNIVSQSKQHDLRFNTKLSDTSEDEGSERCNIFSLGNDQIEEEEDKRRTSRDNKSVDDNYIKKSARHEYKSIMQKLKHPYKENKYNTVSNCMESKKRSAYLSDKEVDVDEWLEDDLGKPFRKKQKKFFSDSIMRAAVDETSPSKTTQNDTTANCQKPSSNLIIQSDSETKNFSDFDGNELDAFDAMMSTNGEGNRINKKSRRNSSAKLQRKYSNQSSLFDAGFSKFVECEESSRFPSPVKNSISAEQHSSCFNDTKLSRSSLAAEKQIIIKVQIEGEKVIVPVNKDSAAELKINWLIEESSRRYYW